MNKTEIEEYLLKIEHQLLIAGKSNSIRLNREWAKTVTKEAGVYVLKEKGEICYIGESGSLQGRMIDLLNTKNHTVRRNIGKFNFSHHTNYKAANSSTSYPLEIELKINEWIESKMTLYFLPLSLGRKELEERLYFKYNPKYNQKGKRGGKSKTYTKSDKQIQHPNAYEPWTEKDDERLELLFCQGKSISQLSDEFGRNKGGIESRIKKLELKEKYGR